MAKAHVESESNGMSEQKIMNFPIHRLYARSSGCNSTKSIEGIVCCRQDIRWATARQFVEDALGIRTHDCKRVTGFAENQRCSIKQFTDEGKLPLTAAEPTMGISILSLTDCAERLLVTSPTLERDRA
jgi:hypothetical protein